MTTRAARNPEPPLDPEILRLVRALARKAAAEDHTRERLEQNRTETAAPPQG